MKRYFDFSRLPLLVILILSFAGCDTAAQNARDAIAASKGAITSAQAKYADVCRIPANAASLPQCVAVTKAIAAQHVAISSLRIYCGYQPGDADETKCKAPDKTVLPTLQSAVANLNDLTNALGALLQ